VFKIGYEELFVALSQSRGGIPQDGPIAQAKVLIVDGEYPTRRTLRSLLLALGCSRIHEASDGESALEAIHTLVPDVVLLDWEVPAMGGATFVRRLRGAGSPAAGVPIIVLLGREEHSRVLEAVRLGVHEFLLKPVASSALRARLLSVLEYLPESPQRDRQPQPRPRKLAS
jgi:two-component system chemotaxis response regulator CheY